MQRHILEGAAARLALLRGVDRMASLVRPTLGPLARTVVVGRIVGEDPPEVLDSGATIARRTLQLADPFEDMGGMLIRNLAWRLYDRVGDGTATAAVLAQSLIREAVKYDAAGFNPVPLRRGVDRARDAALEALRRQARPIDGPAEITRLIAPQVRNPELAEMIGEIVDSAGADGAILVEDAHEVRTTYEYVDGVRWNEGYVSSFLLPQYETNSMRVLNPYVLVTDHIIERAEQLVPALEACVAAGERTLFIVAPEVRDAAVGLLVINRERGVLESAIAVRAPSVGTQRLGILQDIAVITGARCISHERGDTLQNVTIDDLGRVRQAWATRVAFGIVGGHGAKADVRRRIGELKAQLKDVPVTDVYTTSRLYERIGKLAGITAIIRVGAPTSVEQAELKLRVEASVRSARLALQDGVVPGGGAALLRCAPALSGLEISAEERVGVAALGEALAEPMRVILSNAGIEPSTLIAEARLRDEVYDVPRRQWVEPFSTGLVEPLAVTSAALETSVSAASLALTADVLIHRKNAPTVVNP